jgi:hypothetical protein
MPGAASDQRAEKESQNVDFRFQVVAQGPEFAFERHWVAVDEVFADAEIAALSLKCGRPYSEAAQTTASTARHYVRASMTAHVDQWLAAAVAAAAVAAAADAAAEVSRPPE